jgi:phenylpropionate dioxygenase-like ring-hydroxylating dioxygenase large terminal subunit
MKYAKTYTALGTGPLAAADCVSQDYFDRERESVFKRSWICIGREQQVEHPGDYFVRDFKMARTSILTIRGKDNKIRAFHNFCAHRLNKLLKPGEGRCRKIVCQFHGWVFDDEGQLVHVGNEHLFANFNKKEHGLHSIHLEIWEKFIFINLAEKPETTLREWLGPIADAFQGYFDNFEISTRFSVSMNCNWKIAVDSQTEAYHAGSLHARTLKDVFSGKDNPAGLLLRATLYERHRAMSVYSNTSYQPSPAELLAGKIASVPMYPATSALLSKLPAAVNPNRDPEWAFDLFLIFPNLLIVPGSGTCLIEWFWPEAVNKTLLDVWNYTLQPQTFGDLIASEYANVHLRDVLREDFSTLEGTQEGMESGIQGDVLLCDEEIAVRHHHQVVAKMVQQGP